MPVPGDREVLLETIFLSIDPYMRWWIRGEKSCNDPIEISQVMVGGTVSRVRQSRHPDWQEGEWVLASSGWHALTLTRVAERAGVTKPIAYEHFGTRSGLLMALYRRYNEERTEAMRRALKAAGAPSRTSPAS